MYVWISNVKHTTKCYFCTATFIVKKKISWIFEDICPSKMLLCACTFSNVFSLKLTTSEISYAFLKQMHIISPLLTWNYQ